MFAGRVARLLPAGGVLARIGGVDCQERPRHALQVDVLRVVLGIEPLAIQVCSPAHPPGQIARLRIQMMISSISHLPPCSARTRRACMASTFTICLKVGAGVGLAPHFGTLPGQKQKSQNLPHFAGKAPACGRCFTGAGGHPLVVG